MSADDRTDVDRQVAKHVGPSFKSAVDQDHFLIVSGRGVTKANRAEAVDLDRDLLGHCYQQLLMVRLELRCAPDRQGVVGEADVDPVRHLEQFAVRVSAHQDRSVPREVRRSSTSVGCGPQVWSPVTTMTSASATSGSSRTRSRAGSTPWMSESTATVETMSPRCHGRRVRPR